MELWEAGVNSISMSKLRQGEKRKKRKKIKTAKNSKSSPTLLTSSPAISTHLHFQVTAAQAACGSRGAAYPQSYVFLKGRWLGSLVHLPGQTTASLPYPRAPPRLGPEAERALEKAGGSGGHVSETASPVSAWVRSCIPHGGHPWVWGIPPGWPSGIISPAGLREPRVGSWGDPSPAGSSVESGLAEQEQSRVARASLPDPPAEQVARGQPGSVSPGAPGA